MTPCLIVGDRPRLGGSFDQGEGVETRRPKLVVIARDTRFRAKLTGPLIAFAVPPSRYDSADRTVQRLGASLSHLD